MITINTIVVPQGAEYKAVCRGLQKAQAKNVRVISIPIGMNNIDQTWMNNLVSDKSQKVLIMGLCGSLSQQYSVGDAVLYHSCGYTDGEKINLDSELNQTIKQKLSVDLVAGLTSDRLIYQKSEKLKLGQIHNAVVVDMEGYGYLKELQAQKISVAMVRVISDDLMGDIPDLSQAIDTEGNLNTILMAIAFLKQPTAAIRLIKGSLTGLKRLEQVVDQLNYFCLLQID